MATAAVSRLLGWSLCIAADHRAILQNPPLYLHITSTTKEGLEKAVQHVEELMKQELPNLVDERRFRRREPEQVERDEFGRVRSIVDRISLEANRYSVNGLRNEFQLILIPFQGSIYEPR